MFAAKNEFFTSPSGYQISRSVRLRSSASAYFNRSVWSSANRTTWTASIWIKRGVLGSLQTIMGSYDGVSVNASKLYFTSGDVLAFDFGGSAANTISTSAVFRDPSSWYHIVLLIDTTQATAANRIGIYVNGVKQTTTGTPVAQNTNTLFWVTSNNAYFGVRSADYLDGYLAEINVVNGQALTPSSFGQYNAYGVWQPLKYTGTYGTNGFYLNFSDNSNNTATTIGKDYSGNGNNWTPNNISVTSGTTYDSMLDVPTNWADGGNGRGNYAVMNPLAPSSYVTLNAGNLTATGNTATNSGMAVASIGTSTGKYVWEETITTVSGNFPGVGATTVILQDGNGQNPAASNTLGFYYRANGTIYKNSASLVGTYSTFSNGDVVRFELDADALTCAVYKNNTLIVTITGLTAGTFYPSNVNYNSSVTNSNFGQRPFANTPSSGFVALNTQNLPAPTISNGALYMAATLYTGTGSSQTIANTVNGVNFKPDLVWIKSRSAATDHKLTDSVRGTTKALISDTTGAETTDANGLTAFGSTGFTVGSDTTYNNNTATYVGWQWQAGQGTTSSNTSGSITSTVSVNTTAGFSIVTYTGTGANATVGHGLGVAPSLVIVKSRTGGTSSWAVWITGFSGTEYLLLESTAAKGSAASVWNSTVPNSTVVSIGTGSVPNNNGWTYVMYCWAAVAGYSAFGSYTGNGSTDGPFVFLGFRPRWVMIKRTDAAGFSWTIEDSSRSPYNASDKILYANLSDAENTGTARNDFLSNGFKARDSGNNNVSGGTYIFAAFAENPFKLALAR